jgi:cytochrome c553
MKRFATVIAAVALSAGSATAVFAAATAGSGIYQTAHDINFKLGPAVEDVQDRLCAYCHTPHHAYTATDAAPVGPVLAASGYAPLWSHGVTTSNYTPYASATFDVLGGQTMANDPLIGPSRLCMSCHDGTVALDSYYGQTGTHFISNGANTYFGAQPLIELDGQKTHPIGFDATAVDTGGAQEDSHLWANFTAKNYRGNVNAGTLTVSSRLYQGQFFTCSTCHDVHNKLNDTSASIKTGTQNYFLLGGQTNSALCITCHTQAETTYGSVPVTNGSAL